jgi:phosphoribosylformimino-5-aminoimidazole carboxamide ribotide isomerase
MGMTILPAIDLQDGACVRLRQGRAEEATVYSANPVEMALHWQAEGGEYLHVVDLSGAFAGHPVHGDVIARMVEALSIPVEVGGGIRTDADIETVLGWGVDRVILGTRACASPEAVADLAERYGERLAVGIDARDGRVQVQGWTETTDVLATELAAALSQQGVRTVIYTDTARDGMLGGVNAEAMAAICDAVQAHTGVIASGGVSTVADIQRLRALDRANLTGAIVGKALYEQSVTVAALKEQAAC